MSPVPDDGGSFDRMRREAEEDANGDQELTWKLVTIRIIHALKNAISKKVKENESVHIDNLGFYIPKRRRNGRGSVNMAPKLSSDILQVVENKKSLKRRCSFDKAQNTFSGEEGVRKLPPKSMRMTKEITSRPQHEVGSDPPAEMPQAFMDCIREMNGRDVLLVMQKEITECDLSKKHNRLSIPSNKIQNDFLTQEELNKLDTKEGVSVLLLQPSLEITQLLLKKWLMTTTYTYNLIGGWHKEVVKNHTNKLKTGCMVQLWSFRISGKLCFALLKI